MVKSEIQIKSRIMINFGVSVKALKNIMQKSKYLENCYM